MADIINNIVGGRYYILELIGRGGSAIVYKARDIHNGGIYALKKYITSDPANRKRLLEGMERELEVLKNFKHFVLRKKMSHLLFHAYLIQHLKLKMHCIMKNCHQQEERFFVFFW